MRILLWAILVVLALNVAILAAPATAGALGLVVLIGMLWGFGFIVQKLANRWRRDGRNADKGDEADGPRR